MLQLWLWHMADETHLIAEAEDPAPGADPLRVKLGLTAVVRRWGTEHGRGELCRTGPTGKTICDLEPAGGEVNWLHVRRRIPVTPEAEKSWRKFLSGKK